MAGRITIDGLSDSLKEYLNTLGLSEEQVNQLIDKFENEKIGDLSTLTTENKTVVAAINELFQNVNNGKELIATAIGDKNITKDSTFSAMSEAIEEIHADREAERQKLIEILTNSGYELIGNESIDILLEILNSSDIDLSKIVQIACGDNHTLILKNDGSVWACGYNNNGQLGLGNNNSRTTFIQVITNINNDVKQIACGSNHTFILKDDGSLWACGYNNTNGQLGLGDTTSRNTFTQVTTNINNDVKQISCGYDYTFILKNDGSLWSCGRNSEGQLGLGEATTRYTFTQVTTNINNDVKQVICGYIHTFILKNDGSVWACGRNNNGQLGLGDNTDRKTFTQVTTNINNSVKQIACGRFHTIMLKNDGTIWSCGNNNNGQLGLGDTTNRSTFTQVTTNINNDVKQIACRGYHIFILKSDGSLWSCGYNNKGQLGLSDTIDRSTFTQVTTNINNDIKQIDCGVYQTFTLKNDGSLWVCGNNEYGQLGLGDNAKRTTFTEVVESEALRTQIELLKAENVVNKNNLSGVLIDESVEVTDTDTMADLILKVDNEFTNKNNEISSMVVPAGDAIASDVASGKTFINNTGQIITGTASAYLSVLENGGDSSKYAYTPKTANSGKATLTHNDGYLNMYTYGSSYQTGKIYFNINEEFDLTDKTMVLFDLSISGNARYVYYKFGVYEGTDNFTENTTLVSYIMDDSSNSNALINLRAKYIVDVSSCTGIHKIGIYFATYGTYSGNLNLYNIEIK